MSDKTTITVQIPHECEQWLGTASRDRIMSLRSVGLSVANIARRFDVSREMIYRVMRSGDTALSDASEVNP